MIDQTGPVTGPGRCHNTVGGSPLPGREVVSMVTYSELFAYTMVLIGIAMLVFQDALHFM